MLPSRRQFTIWYLHRIAPQALVDAVEMYQLEKAEPFIRSLAPFIDKHRDAIDVGANVGLYTVFFKKLVRNVHAFEPLPILADRLRVRHRKRVQIHQTAVGSEDGSATLYVPSRNDRLVRSRASLNADANEGFDLQPVEVEVRTLDSYGFDNVGVIKIDVEGHEMDTIKGADQTIRTCRPLLIVEIEERHHPGESWQIIDHVRAIGYDAHYFRGTDMLPIDSFDFDAMQNPSNLKTPSGPYKGEYINNFVFIPRDT